MTFCFVVLGDQICGHQRLLPAGEPSAGGGVIFTSFQFFAVRFSLPPVGCAGNFIWAVFGRRY